MKKFSLISYRDIKASNILLDKDLTAALSDFGLAKLIPANMAQVSTKVAGTLLARYKGFKDGKRRILIATDLVGRGIDIERVNIIINYDMPDSADTYLDQVGRAGRFGTKALAITFVYSTSGEVRGGHQGATCAKLTSPRIVK